MFQEDGSIIEKSNITSDAIIVNQCNLNDITYYNTTGSNILFYSTKERGLSKSRNTAIRLSKADIVLIADDDEIFTDTCETAIKKAFANNPECSVLTFNIENLQKKKSDKEYYVGYIEALKTSSVQIAFRLKDIKDNNINFQENMGSGSGNGSGEEIKFLFDCLKANLKIKHIPLEIATLDRNSESLWFKGFDKKYLIDRGWATKQYLGKFWATIYSIEFCIVKYQRYKNEISLFEAFKFCLKGIRQTR